MSAHRRDKGTSRRGRRSALGRLISWTLALGIWALIGVIATVAWYGYDLPDAGQLGAVERTPTITLVGSDGGEIASFGDLYSRPVQLADLPPALIQAVLATEDRRFYDHFGLDLIGSLRAAYVNLRAGRIEQGGSTITQQLAKNIFLSPERTIKRKVQETLLALWLERKLSKGEILTLYLNRVYLGAGAYGFDAAARRYFGKPAARVSLSEAAMLAGLLKAPSRYAPSRDLALARARASQVLANMVAAGYLAPAQAGAAKRRPAALKAPPRAATGARYFADWVLEQVPRYVGHTRRDLRVVTTLDRGLQRAAGRVVREALSKHGARLNVGQGALVALTPHGAVRAMVGGRSYAESQFNRAVQALRQPGSAFKLFVYLAGLEAGLEPDDVMRDEPVRIGDWQPRNYAGTYSGEVTLRQALARSINTVAVKVSERAGRARVIEAARRLGLTAELKPHPSLALGAAEVSLLDLTTAYAPLANGGEGVWAHAITEIRDGAGQVLYRRRGSGLGRVIGPRELAQLNDMLSAAIAEGTGKAARLGRPAAGKTGTSQDFRDAWFIGYTADLVAGVWLGNDDAAPMKGVTGGRLPARIWRDFMSAAHAGRPPRPIGPSAPSRPGLLERLFATGERPARAPRPRARQSTGRGSAGAQRRLRRGGQGEADALELGQQPARLIRREPRQRRADVEPARLALLLREHLFQGRDQGQPLKEPAHAGELLLQGVRLRPPPAAIELGREVAGDVDGGGDAPRPAGAQGGQEELLRAREDAELRQGAADGLGVRPIARAVLDADHGPGIRRHQALDQTEAHIDPGHAGEVIEKDFEPFLAHALDGLRICGEQAVLADALVIERRQHQHSGGAQLQRRPCQAHRVGDGAAAGADDEAARVEAARPQRLQKLEPFAEAERVGLPRRAQHRQAVAAPHQQPAEMLDHGCVIGAQIPLERGQRGGQDPLELIVRSLAHGAVDLPCRVAALARPAIISEAKCASEGGSRPSLSPAHAARRPGAPAAGMAGD